jgi:nicotinate-nucleotide adenylyltransferase
MRGAPLATRGMRVGLLGGSFDPAHAGHAHVAETALARLDLDAVWWLVSPQNPLKPESAPLPARLASARAAAKGPRMVVTDIETRLGARYTIDTLRALRKAYPGVRFIWLMGGDNLAGFQRWKGWQDIARTVPICVVSRPGAGPRARLGKLARRFPGARRALQDFDPRAFAPAPVWLYMSARWNKLSSTSLRARGLGLAR